MLFRRTRGKFEHINMSTPVTSRQLFRSSRQHYMRTGSNRTTSGHLMTSCGRTSHITTTLRRGLRTGPTFTSSTFSAKPKASRCVFMQVNAFPETIRRLLKKSPVDHYIRPLWLSIHNNWLHRRSSAYCYNDKPLHNLLLNATEE